jgi:hypothetical protein
MVKIFKKLTLIFLLYLILPSLVAAANLSIIPASGTYKVGDVITVKVVITSDVLSNAVSSKVKISPTYFSVQTISKANSVLNFWVTEPSFDKVSGTVDFEGVALSGFQGSSGTIGTIQLKALQIGTGNISFQSGQILADDGEGTDITGSMTGATFNIIEAPKKITPVQPAVEPIKEPIKEPSKAAEIPQPQSNLKAPEILFSNQNGTQSVVGTSEYPKAQVLLNFVAPNGSNVFITGTTNDDGSFNLVIPNLLKHGEYAVNAVIVKEDNTKSEKSNAIVVKIGNILSDSEPEILWLIVSLIIVIIYLLMRTDGKSIDGEKKPEIKENNVGSV